MAKDTPIFKEAAGLGIAVVDLGVSGGVAITIAAIPWAPEEVRGCGGVRTWASERRGIFRRWSERLIG
jgi:hypothetical protein